MRVKKLFHHCWGCSLSVDLETISFLDLLYSHKVSF